MVVVLVYLQFAFAFLAVCGLGYFLLCLWSARSFSRRATPAVSDSQLAPVSILKPLKGADRELYESIRSHCLQEYPSAYELIFGVSEPDDPAVPLVRRLMAEFPGRNIRLVICPRVLGMNRKVSNLAQMLSHAQYEHVLVNDSDIKVSSHYLRGIMSEFADPGVGMVTCLYRGAAHQTLASSLESVGISTDFAAGVLAARQIEGGIHFALGSTLAMRRDALAQIGSFEAVVDCLGDDYELGCRIARAGWKVELSPEVVDTFLPPYTFKTFWEHQLRWARSTRDSRSWGYAGIVFTFGLCWALLTVVAARGATWSWGLALILLVARIAVALEVGARLLADRDVVRRLALVPLRDVAALAVWLWSFAGDTIVWRGERMLLRDGRLHPVDARGRQVAPVGGAAAAPERGESYQQP